MSARTTHRRRKAAGLVPPPVRYPFDASFFAAWSDDLAWLTGLIWSDGNLRGTHIDLCSKDRDLMETVAALIGQANGVRPKNHGTAWRVGFSSPVVSQWFRSIGLTEAKSFTVDWPIMPEQYSPAFVRGLLDGDGSVHVRHDRPGQQVADLRVEWVGASPPLRIALIAWLERNALRATNGISHGRVWRVGVSQQSSLRRLHELLYPSAHIPALQRKRTAYDAWMLTPRPRPGRKAKQLAPLSPSSGDE